MDAATKSFWEKVVHQLEHLNKTLDALLEIVKRPRQQHDPTPENASSATNEENTAGREMQPLLHIRPAPNHQAKPRDKWYQSPQGWKGVLEPVALGFAILYACVTGYIAYVNYNQWQDANRNFMADERSWAKITYSSSRELNSTDNAATIATITNTGKSVITSMYGAARLEVLSMDTAPSFADPSKAGQRNPGSAITGGPIFPGEPTTFPINLVDGSGKARPYSQAEVADLQSGKSYIASWGYLAYRDHFGTHWYRFCSWFSFDHPQVGSSGAYSEVSNQNTLKCTVWNEVGEGEAPPGFKPVP
jgi:hypothetical protein